MISRKAKGDSAYLKQKKRWEILKTFLLFGISAAIFIMGYLSTGSKSNLLTVIAILGCLPASKSTVSMVMHLRIKGCSETTKQEIEQRFGKDFGIYNLYFTSYQKNYEIHHLVVKGPTIICYSEVKETDENGFQEHIKDILTRGGIKGVNIKLYKNLEKYLERIDQLLPFDEKAGREEEILSILHSVSL